MIDRFEIVARPLAVALLSLLAPAVAARAADPVIVPAAARNAEGNSNNLYPFNGAPMRYQQIFAASEFSGGKRRITHIVLRPDASSGESFSETLTQVRISLSTTLRPVANLSKTFSQNTGPDETLIHDGPLPLASNHTGPASGPKNFDIVIPLSATFDYDPLAGNLLLDVRNLSGGKTIHFDAHDAPDSTARVWNDDVDSPTAIENDPFPSAGLVIAFLSD